MKAILCFILMSLSVVSFGQRKPGSVSFTIKTVDNSKHYSPAHVLAIWVEDGDGKFVKTLKIQANHHRQNLYTWNAKSAGNTVDAITGPTLPNHISHTVTWNFTDTTGTVVKDGMYKIVTEFTSEHAQGPIQAVSFKKGARTIKLIPENQPYFIDMQMYK